MVRNTEEEVIEHISLFLRILVGFAINNKLRDILDRIFWFSIDNAFMSD